MSYTFDQIWARPFAPRSTEPSSLGTTKITLHPRETLDKSTNIFSFDFPTLGEQFPNLKSIQLFVSGQLRHEDNTTLGSNEDAALINNPLHSLFSSITVVVGQNQTSLTYNDYPFLALMQMADKIGEFDRRLNMTFFLPDNGLVPRGGTITLGHTTRKVLAAGSADIHMMGHLWCDIIDMDSFLMKHTPFTLQLKKAAPNFYVQSSTDKSYNFVINKIQLVVDMVLPNPALVETIERQLETVPAKYGFDHLSMKKFTISEGIQSHNISRVWSGVLPRRFAFTFIPQDDYVGKLTSDPSIFTTGKVKSITLKINEMEFVKIDLSFSKVPAYSNLLQFLQVGGQTFITPNVFVKTLPLLCVDLNTLCQINESCITEVHPSGTMSMEMTFEEAVSKPMIMIMYAFNTAYLSIDRSRDASIDVNLA